MRLKLVNMILWCGSEHHRSPFPREWLHEVLSVIQTFKQDFLNLSEQGSK
jgi:hypothetical protein